MLEELLVHNVWLAIAIWTVLYISDYQLTIASARLYQAGAQEYLAMEGSFELTPYYQQDIDALRRFSPRFFLLLVLYPFLILVIWLLSVQWAPEPELFSWFIGAFILLEVVVHIRHVRNFVFLRYAKNGQGLKGRLERARWIVLKLSSVDFLIFAALFLFVFLVSGSWFFVGGTISCAATALKHWRWANKAHRTQQQVKESNVTPERQPGPRA